MPVHSIIGPRPPTSWNLEGGTSVATAKPKRAGGSVQATGYSLAPKGAGAFMDTRRGDDFHALSPPMSVRQWAGNSGNQPMVTRVKHLTSGSHYWFLFNHGSGHETPYTIAVGYDMGIHGDPGRLLGINHVISCYPPHVQGAMAGVGDFLASHPNHRFTHPWVNGTVFDHLAGVVAGTEWSGVVLIGHTNKFQENSFWLDFTNDPD